MREVIRLLDVRPGESYFWATHAGAELDLFVTRGSRRLGVEVKRTSAPRTSISQHSAIESLGLDELIMVHAGSSSFPMGPRIRAVAFADLGWELPRF